MNKWISFLNELADKADKISLAFFRNKELSTKMKHDNSPVTEADQKIERVIRELVDKRFPKMDVLGEEEGGNTESSSLKLIIDPIDGTRNFMRGIPIYATLLAIQENGEIVAGLVSAPALHGRWWASKGDGAYYNGESIHVSKIDEISDAYGFHSKNVNLESKEIEDQIHALLSDSQYARGFGEFYQHMLVAMGSGEYALNVGDKGGINIWDTAAFKIIVEEAGGKCSNIEGDETALAGDIISSNGILHDEVLEYFRNK